MHRWSIPELLDRPEKRLK